MKRFFLVALAAFALLTPNFAAAQDALRLVYRPELRAFVPAPQQAKPAAPVSTLTPAETIARHQAMVRGHRVNPNGHVAMTAHCDQLVKQAIEAAARDN